MDFEYQFKDLIELIPFEPSKPPLLGIWNCYGDGLLRYAANQEGLWLCKQGRGFNELTDSRLTGLSKQDIAEKTIEGFGIVYGTKDGAPLLPIPFTAHELFIFNAINRGLITQINERGEFEQKWIADLAERNIDAADLAATILYGDLPMDADIYPSMPAPVETDEIDFTMLATRNELIDAFGRHTGMNMTWFDNLTDTPKLNDARKVTGQGGHHSVEPLFCPYEVMQWLADPKRKKGKPLLVETAWRLLKGNFERVYNQYSIGDPNAD